MQVIKLSIFTTIVFTAFASLAYAPSEGNITAYFGPYLYKTNFKGSNSGANSPALAGLGLVVNGDVNEKGSLEIALFVLNKIYFREEAGRFLGEQTALAHFSMGYRKWFAEKVSAALSFSSGYSIGSPNIVHSDFPAGSEIDTSAKDTVEYGFELSLLSELMKRENYVVVIDARYTKSVTPKQGEYADQFGLMLGWRYIVQERVAPPRKTIQGQ